MNFLKNKVGKFPPWIKKKISYASNFFETSRIITRLKIHTVCQQAQCPNIWECFERKKATFLLLGSICTRNCKFCRVTKGNPFPLDKKEPERIAKAVKLLSLNYVVLTSVTRDDLKDGGAEHFVITVKSIRAKSSEIKIELLIPDFRGQKSCVKKIVSCSPDVISHNIETVPSLFPIVRKTGNYKISIKILKRIKEIKRSILTKSALLLGFGETKKEVILTIKEIRETGCDILTIGQYLRPKKDNFPVKRFITPSEFEEYKDMGLKLGFRSVIAGPFVRSSYDAENHTTLSNTPEFKG